MEQRNANSPHKRDSNSNHASHRFRWTTTLVRQAHITESCRPIGKNRFVTTGNPRNPTGYSLDHAHRSAYLTTCRVHISYMANEIPNISSLLNVNVYIYSQLEYQLQFLLIKKIISVISVVSIKFTNLLMERQKILNVKHHRKQIDELQELYV